MEKAFGKGGWLILVASGCPGFGGSKYGPSTVYCVLRLINFVCFISFASSPNRSQPSFSQAIQNHSWCPWLQATLCGREGLHIVNSLHRDVSKCKRLCDTGLCGSLHECLAVPAENAKMSSDIASYRHAVCTRQVTQIKREVNISNFVLSMSEHCQIVKK